MSRAAADTPQSCWWNWCSPDHDRELSREVGALEMLLQIGARERTARSVTETD